MGGRGSSGGGKGGGGGTAKMPELTGSPKQVAWAEDIRREAFERIELLNTNYNSLYNRAPASDKKIAVDTLGYTPKDVQVVKEVTTEVFQRITSAKEIIDNRHALTYKELQFLAQSEHRTGEVSEMKRQLNAQKRK